jgi:hypothetical protein
MRSREGKRFFFFQFPWIFSVSWEHCQFSRNFNYRKKKLHNDVCSSFHRSLLPSHCTTRQIFSTFIVRLQHPFTMGKFYTCWKLLLTENLNCWHNFMNRQMILLYCIKIDKKGIRCMESWFVLGEVSGGVEYRSVQHMLTHWTSHSFCV